jgi:two-component system, chemotaxis family, CheB/CheR fusion protein
MKPPSLIVGIGASSGGLESIQTILRGLPSDASFAVVVVQHVNSEGEEMLAQLLSKICPLPVRQVEGPVQVAAGVVYIAPARCCLEIKEGKLRAIEPSTSTRHATIDYFLASLATDQKERAVGIVLSGNGTDGTLGLKSISDEGGMTMAQSSESAKVPSMPESAASLGIIDYILAPAMIASELVHHAEQMEVADDSESPSSLNRQIIEALPAITAAVEKQTENDFKHYKTTTLVRRIRRRIQVLKITSVDSYVELLQSSREEAQRLFRELLISVTEFFRDPETFEALAEAVLAKRFAANGGHDPMRVWVAGCATGEEAYSVAILILEAMDDLPQRVPVQIFATDLDDRALQTARAGSYPVGIQEQVSPDRLRRFFTKRANRYFVNKEVRDLIVFSAHNLISDPPFTKQDLILCRNLLIYLGSHLQKKLIPLFHYAIKPGGHLFLGPSESMSGHKELFIPIDAKHRIYQRKLTAIGSPSVGDMPSLSPGRYALHQEAADSEVDLFQFGQRISLDEFAPQWAIVDDDAQIYALSADPSAYLRLSGGTFKNNLISLAHSGLKLGLRAAFSDAKKTRRRVIAENLSVPVDGGTQRVSITVQPMPEVGQDASLHFVAFQNIGEPLHLGEADDAGWHPSVSGVSYDKAKSLIDQLESELATTRSDLERTVQELEAANEELKSSNEELLSMNEELQSANEELETSKEELIRSNDTLARSNSDLENLLQSTSIATIFLDKQYRIRNYTPAAKAIYALIESDIGRPLVDLSHKVESMPVLPTIAEMKELDQPIENTVHVEDGRWFIRRVHPYRAANGTADGIVVTFTDVTELRTNQQRLEMALHGGSLGAWDLDLKENLAWRSPRHDEIFGYDEPLAVWTFNSFLHHVHPDDLERTETFFRNASKELEWQHECRIRRQDGAVRWISIHARNVLDELGTAIRMYGTVADITDVKNAQVAIETHELQFRTLADNIAQFAWMAEPNGDIDWYNKRWFDYTGTTIEQVQGWGWTSVHHPEHLDRVIANFKKALESRSEFEDTFPLRRYDGEYRWFLTRMIPIFDDSGNVVRWFGTNTDVTEQKAIEAELDHARHMAEAANQAKSDFLANMSHEIRSPMTAILGFADLLKVTDVEEMEKVETIRRNGQFLLELVNDILDLSKIEAGKVTVEAIRFDPTRLLEDVCSLMTVRAVESGLSLKVIYENPIPIAITSDPIRMRQVLINLVGNAIKFTEDGGVTLKLRYLDSDKQLCFDVVDTGIGISEEKQAKLFRPFEQADSSIVRRYGGSGLGLAISERLAELLGGHIQVRSKEGQGSTFSLVVDCVNDPDLVDCQGRLTLQSNGNNHTETTMVLNHRDVTNGSGRIDIRALIVDDRRDIRFLTQHFVKQLGGEVLLAENGVEALRTIDAEEQAGRLIDIVLMDVQMPEMDGFTAVRTLRERGFDRPVIALTANAMDSDRDACIAAGYTDYLSKPIDIQKLITALRKYSAS